MVAEWGRKDAKLDAQRGGDGYGGAEGGGVDMVKIKIHCMGFLKTFKERV